MKGLANNPTFQRFAVRSSQKASDLSKNATEAAKTISESESLAQFRRVSHPSTFREQAGNTLQYIAGILFLIISLTFVAHVPGLVFD